MGIDKAAIQKFCGENRYDGGQFTTNSDDANLNVQNLNTNVHIDLIDLSSPETKSILIKAD